MRQLKIQKSITNRSSEALDKYLVEIGRQPLVTIDEEIELAQAIRKGGPEGEKAKERLVTANLRFVVSVAKQYQHQGLTLTDLIDEGNIGLVKAAEKFDETRGFKFISYAVWWIRQSILQAIAEQSRIVRLPTAKADSHHMSIDAPFGEDDDNSMADMLSSGDDSRTDKHVDYESLTSDLDNVLRNVLKDRELKIVKECFGIGCQERGLEEIGAEMGLTRERVRQIREKSIAKLHESGHARILIKYLG